MSKVRPCQECILDFITNGRILFIFIQEANLTATISGQFTLFDKCTFINFLCMIHLHVLPLRALGSLLVSYCLCTAASSFWFWPSVKANKEHVVCIIAIQDYGICFPWIGLLFILT